MLIGRCPFNKLMTRDSRLRAGPHFHQPPYPIITPYSLCLWKKQHWPFIHILNYKPQKNFTIKTICNNFWRSRWRHRCHTCSYSPMPACLCDMTSAVLHLAQGYLVIQACHPFWGQCPQKVNHKLGSLPRPASPVLILRPRAPKFFSKKNPLFTSLPSRTPQNSRCCQSSQPKDIPDNCPLNRADGTTYSSWLQI